MYASFNVLVQRYCPEMHIDLWNIRATEIWYRDLGADILDRSRAETVQRSGAESLGRTLVLIPCTAGGSLARIISFHLESCGDALLFTHLHFSRVEEMFGLVVWFKPKLS